MVRKGLIILLLFMVQPGHGMKLKKVVNFDVKWRFQIGDARDYAAPHFDDAKWEQIEIGNEWEKQGFPGYDGIAWYRIRFVIPSSEDGKNLYIKLGLIDDADQTFLNGQLIGELGSFPPHPKTAYNIRRLYPVPPLVPKIGKENVLAIRVCDFRGAGGLVDDKVGLYRRVDLISLAIDLAGKWKFHTGDDLHWLFPEFDDDDWKEIKVPAYWEVQGFANYDGMAWYRKKVRINSRLAKEKLVLMLGKINDIDEVYFNGVMIGRTGVMPTANNKGDWSEKKNIIRAYHLPPDLIQQDAVNHIAVRVFDAGKNGGIYEEYVGIARHQDFQVYQKTFDND